MGEKLINYFKLAKNQGGILYQVRLAMKAGMSSETAKKEPDSPENIKKFEEAFKEIANLEK